MTYNESSEIFKPHSCPVFESRGNPGVTRESRVTPGLRENSMFEFSNPGVNSVARRKLTRRHWRGNPGVNSGQVKSLLTSTMMTTIR